jgi:hypothetical protein
MDAGRFSARIGCSTTQVTIIMTLPTLLRGRGGYRNRRASLSAPNDRAHRCGRTGSLSRMSPKSLLIVLAHLLIIQIGCAFDAKGDDSGTVARKAVDALLANDPQTLNALIAPDRRRSGTPPGLSLGFPEMTMLEDCRWTGLQRFDEADGASADERVVTAIFANACVAEHPWTVPTRNALSLVLRKIDGRWYVYDFR